MLIDINSSWHFYINQSNIRTVYNLFNVEFNIFVKKKYTQEDLSAHTFPPV